MKRTTLKSEAVKEIAHLIYTYLKPIGGNQPSRYETIEEQIGMGSSWFEFTRGWAVGVGVG